MEENVLSLDISTKTGWAFMVSSVSGLTLVDYGTLDQEHMPDGAYPNSFIDWAYRCYNKIMELVDRFAPEVLVIEETSAGSKAIYTQKILEWIHFLIAKFVADSGIKAVYLKTEEWRREVGCKMTKDESKHNKKVRDYKKKHGTIVAKNEEGKRIGIKGRKHINIRRANEIFGSQLEKLLVRKDEDKADAMLLLATYHKRRFGSTI